MAQDVSKDYLVFTKTIGYQRRILMPLNQKINIHLKGYQKLSKVYLSKISPNNLVLNDGRVISFDLIDKISGRTFVINNDKNFGKFMVGLGVAAIIVATGIIILEVAGEGGFGFGTAYAAPSILLAGGLVYLGFWDASSSNLIN